MQFGFSPLDAAMSYTLFPILLILLFLMISWTGTQYLPLFMLRPLPSFQLFWCILLFLWNLAVSSSIASIASTLTFHPLCVISPSLFLLHVSSSPLLHSLHLYPFHPSFHTLPQLTFTVLFLFFFVRRMIHSFSARTDTWIFYKDQI